MSEQHSPSPPPKEESITSSQKELENVPSSGETPNQPTPAKEKENGGASSSRSILLKVEHLKKYFPVKKGFFSRTKGWVKAVDDISFEIREGETLGLVGESGCGKTTAGRTILNLIPPTSGQVYFRDNPVFDLRGKRLLEMRKKMQIIFQDPFSSLNPRMTVSDIISEGMIVHKLAKGRRQERVNELLQKVGLSPDHRNRYPHEFSGGQRQRIGIARALSVEPEFIVCDESVSALDVSIQAQIINLLKKLQREEGLAYLFIAHDLAVVEHISDRIAVMYLGKIVELAPAREIYQNPRHPYTRSLLSAIPVPDPRRRSKRILLEGDVPTPINPPSGCPFHTRCPIATKECEEKFPDPVQIGPEHFSYCLYAQDAKLDEVPVPQLAEKG
ncbi:MAG: ATP-binding cassette domain-containing protein [Planctomycetota bacterium]|nr:MAG: ATP-binding cassette domain-containing protein [Planctomycetota bacterium]